MSKEHVMRGLISILLVFVCFQGVSAATIEGKVYDSLLEPMNVLVQVNSSPTQVVVAVGGSYQFSLDRGTYQFTILDTKGKVLESFSLEVNDEGTFTHDVIVFPSVEKLDDDEIVGDSFSREIARDLVSEEDHSTNNETDADGRQEVTSKWLLLNLVFITLFFIALIFAKRQQESRRGKKRDKRNSQKKISAHTKKKRTSGQKRQPQEKKRERSGDSRKILPQQDLMDSIVRVLHERGGVATQKQIRQRVAYSEAMVSIAVSVLESEGIIKKVKKGRGNIIRLEKKL